jgi:opacity protein-like surface antigen
VTQNVGVYGMLGVGGYHESLELTERAVLGGVVCDPWGFCSVVATTGDVSVASKSLTRFGWNVGLGVEFARHGSSSWFVEARYHSVLGSRSVQFMPLQVGYRF